MDVDALVASFLEKQADHDLYIRTPLDVGGELVAEAARKVKAKLMEEYGDICEGPLHSFTQSQASKIVEFGDRILSLKDCLEADEERKGITKEIIACGDQLMASYAGCREILDDLKRDKENQSVVNYVSQWVEKAKKHRKLIDKKRDLDSQVHQLERRMDDFVREIYSPARSMDLDGALRAMKQEIQDKTDARDKRVRDANEHFFGKKRRT